jgi:hypothetical protein
VVAHPVELIGEYTARLVTVIRSDQRLKTAQKLLMRIQVTMTYIKHIVVLLIYASFIGTLSLAKLPT